MVGTLLIDIHFPESSSLKAKRQHLRRIKDKLRNKLNVSVAEVGNNDLWQRTIMGVCVIANEKRFANEILSKAVKQVSEENGVVILNYSMEFY